MARSASNNAGVALTAGQSVYLDTSTPPVWQLADANLAALASATVGITTHASAAGQPACVATGGRLTFNAVLVKGTYYFVSATPGGISPHADLAATMYVTPLGYAESTTSLVLAPATTGLLL